jgi:hypothetical protein
VCAIARPKATVHNVDLNSGDMAPMASFPSRPPIFLDHELDLVHRDEIGWSKACSRLPSRFPSCRIRRTEETSMAAIDVIGMEARRVLFEVMMSMAWADRELAPEECQAAQGAAISMGLVLPSDRDLTSLGKRPLRLDELDSAGLDARDREMIYLCAAWMAMADAVEDPEETELLRALRRKLGIDDERGQWLKTRALSLYESQSNGRASWWRSFDKLVVEAVRAIESASA